MTKAVSLPQSVKNYVLKKPSNKTHVLGNTVRPSRYRVGVHYGMTEETRYRVGAHGKITAVKESEALSKAFLEKHPYLKELVDFLKSKKSI